MLTDSKGLQVMCGGCNVRLRMSKAHQHLAGMANSHESLYERILDTPGFAFHFNELALLAGEADRLRAELAEARAQLAAERERTRALAEQAHYDGYSTGWAENDGSEEPPEQWMEDSWVNSHTRGVLHRLPAPTAAHPEREVEDG